MSQRVINCPHCGKILSPDLWKEKPSQILEAVKCPQCGFQKLYKDGLRKTSQGKVQRYMCRNCGYRFSKQ